MVTKQRVIMHHVHGNEGAYTQWFQEDYTDHGHPRNIVISSVDWAEMGSPEVITVTVMPGDLLNDEPS
jgi:hypothetical protein